MKYNKNTFLNNIRLLTDMHCQGVERVFNDKISQRDAFTRWKKPGINPNFDAISKICEIFNCSFDWLLTGVDPGENFMCGWTEETQKACKAVKKILESGDEKTATALLQNIDAFETSVTRRDENKKNERRKKDQKFKPSYRRRFNRIIEFRCEKNIFHVCFKTH